MARKSRSKSDAREYLLGKLEDIIENESEKTTDRVKAITLYGQEHGLFVEQKNIKFDVSTIVRHFTDGQLAGLAGGTALTNGTDAHVIDVEYLPSAELHPLNNRGADDPHQPRDLMGAGSRDEAGGGEDNGLAGGSPEADGDA